MKQGIKYIGPWGRIQDPWYRKERRRGETFEVPRAEAEKAVRGSPNTWAFAEEEMPEPTYGERKGAPPPEVPEVVEVEDGPEEEAAPPELPLDEEEG